MVVDGRKVQRARHYPACKESLGANVSVEGAPSHPVSTLMGYIPPSWSLSKYGGRERKNLSFAWLYVGESLLRDALGTLKFCLVVKWKDIPLTPHRRKF